jgi:hypothetical protein
MPQLKESLKTRIQELTTSIDSQTAELAAYQSVLQIELAKESTSAEGSPSEARAQTASVPTASIPAVDLSAVEFTGNKTAFVVAIVRAHGAAGATPKEIREVFATRKIPHSDNLMLALHAQYAKGRLHLEAMAIVSFVRNLFVPANCSNC